MSKSKSSSQIQHFKKRMYERHGLVIGKNEYNKILNNVKSGDAEFVEKQSLRVSKYIVEYNGIKLIVIYDKQRKTLVTVLPNNENISYS